MAQQHTGTDIGWLRSPGGRFLTVEVALVLFLLLLTGLPSLFYPFGKDQGEYAYIAAAFLRGERIYEHVFNVKPPLTHLLHAAALLLFGRDMMAIRWWDWLWQGITALLLLAVARQWWGDKGMGWLAAALYAVFYFATDFWHSAQTDGFINLPAAAAVYCFGRGWREWETRRGGARVSWLGVGLGLGAAVLLKYPIGILLPFLLGLLWISKGVERGRESFVDLLRASGLILAGFALPWLIFIFWLTFRGSLAAFWQIQSGYIPQYNAGFVPAEGYWAYSLTLFSHIWQISPHLRGFVYLWGAAAVGLIVTLVRWRMAATRPPFPLGLVILWLWGAAAFIHLVLQNKYYYYHFLPLLPVQALIITYGVSQVAAWLRPLLVRLPLAGQRVAPYTLAAAVLFWLWLASASPYRHGNFLLRYQTVWQLVTGQRSLDEYQRGNDFGAYGWGVFSSRANLELADYLRQHTNPDDKIFIWGFEPGIYFLSQRWSASRFIYNFPLFPQFGWASYREQVVIELIAEPPAMILVAQFDAQPNLTGTEDDSWTILQQFGPLYDFLQRDYQLETTIAQFTLYRYQR